MDRSSGDPEIQAGARDAHIFITLPAYRAERTLGRTVADIPQGLAAELILVDDASPDRTVERARELGIQVFVHSKNRGYGGNQKSCYSIALEQGADIIVLLHPDYQYDPKAVPLLIAPILAGDADMTFGSRFAGLGDPRSGGMPLLRYLGNRFTTFLENVMLKARFTEMHSGMRAYTRSCLLSLPFRGYSDDYLFDSQLLIDAVSSGQRVVEVPIPTRYTDESSSISVLRSLGYVSGSLLYCGRATWRRGRRGRRWPVGISSLRRGPRLGHGRTVLMTCPLCDASIRVAVSSNLLQCLNCGLLSSRGEAAVRIRPRSMSVSMFAACLDRLRRFWVPGSEMAIIGPEAERLTLAARDRGWEAAPVRGVEEFSSRRLDAVFLANSLADMPQPVAALRSLGQSLSPGGIVAVTCSDMLTSRTRGKPLAPESQMHHFTRETLHATLRRGGFRVLDWAEWTGGRSDRGETESWIMALCRRLPAPTV